jgi:pimeloyl-ACP methyl ester carboxylesterase
MQVRIIFVKRRDLMSTKAQSSESIKETQAVNKTEKVISKDSTTIAFEKSGKGPAIVLVVGAFNDRATGAPLARVLERHFTVFNYDRRGRGESGDTEPYAIEREIEDLDALIAQAGGSARVFGYSSGATLALRAAAHGLAISQLALYEPPPTGAKAGQLAPQLTEFIVAGRRGDAVELFQTEAVGIPAAIVAQMRNAPFRPALEKMAHTLIYESMILGSLPTEVLASIRVPTLVIYGEESPEVMQYAAQSLAEILPDGQYRTLKGQSHDIVPTVLSPVLGEFFLTPSSRNKTGK